MDGNVNGVSKLAHPVILFSLLVACKRHDGLTYRDASDKLNFTVESVGKLVETGQLLGDKPLMDALALIGMSPHYTVIAELAGREAFHHLAASFPSFAHIDLKLAMPSAFNKAVNASARLLESLARGMRIGILRQRDSYFLEVRKSPFVNAPSAIVPQCGFITGFIKEAVKLATGKECAVAEAICAASDRSSTLCLFTVSPPIEK